MGRGVSLSPSAHCGFFLVSRLLSRQGHKGRQLGLGCRRGQGLLILMDLVSHRLRWS